MCRGKGFVRFAIGANAIQAGQMFSNRDRATACKSDAAARPDMRRNTHVCDHVYHPFSDQRSCPASFIEQSGRESSLSGTLEQISFAHSYIYKRACALQAYRVNFVHIYVHTSRIYRE